MKMKNETDKKKQEIIKEVLSHHIFVQPQIYSFLETIGISLPIEDKDFDQNKHYQVWTKKFHTSKGKNGIEHFFTDVISAKAIKELLRNKPQFMFPPKRPEVPFNEKDSVLIINDIPIGVTRKTERFHICRLLFGDKNTIGKQWEHDEFISEFEDTTLLDDLFDYLYHKVRHLNDTVDNNTGIKKLILIEKRSIGINPIHLPLFID